jgi:transposase-like protein
VWLGGIPHIQAKRYSNRAEGSQHVPVRRRERKLQRFESAALAQWHLSIHAATRNSFNLRRHLRVLLERQ